MNNIKEAISQSVPHKVVTIKPSDKPWFTKTIKHEMHLRDKFYKKYKANSVEHNLIVYRMQRNKVTDLVRSAKHNYKLQIADKIKNTNICSKDWWKLGKSLLSDTNSAFTQIPPLRAPDGNHVYENADKANLLNNYFTSITKLTVNNPLPQLGTPYTVNTLGTITINSNDVFEILSNLDVTKAIGPDEISPRCLKAGKYILTPQLVKLFNFSLNQGKFPTLWKLAHVIPLFKIGETDKMLQL